MSEDPVRRERNVYVYALDNALRYVDPRGWQAEPCTDATPEGCCWELHETYGNTECTNDCLAEVAGGSPGGEGKPTKDELGLRYGDCMAQQPIKGIGKGIIGGIWGRITGTAGALGKAVADAANTAAAAVGKAFGICPVRKE